MVDADVPSIVNVPPAAAVDLDFVALLERGAGAQAVSFRLGGELHGCDIRLVEEVVTRHPVHPLPDVPPEVLGMLLLRGEMVPVMDVAGALGLQRRAEGAPSVLVVAMGDGRVGVAVESVHEVMDVPADSIRPAPHTGGDRDAYVLGVARLGSGLVNLIDLAEILRERTTLDSGNQS